MYSFNRFLAGVSPGFIYDNRKCDFRIRMKTDLVKNKS
jgi:hypothetical protein